MKKFFEILLYLVLAVLAAGVLLLVFLTVSEYKPADVEPMPITVNTAGKQVPQNKEIELISWNVGFGALGKDADFAMDGGGNAPAADKAQVEANLAGISECLGREKDASIYLLQESDFDSSRSYHIDFRDRIALAQNTFALNYSCPFVPFPWPPFREVNSGLQTVSAYDIEQAERISLLDNLAIQLTERSAGSIARI